MPELLAKVYRNEIIESRHYGHFAIVDQKNEREYKCGKNLKTYWRSSAKLFQALPVITSGAADKYDFTGRELAVMAASHNGEDKHLKVVKNILNKIGLDKTALKCGIHPPYLKKNRKKLYQNKQKPQVLHNNCSGKHAGMLALCRYNNWDIDNYYQKGHPLQDLILETIAEIIEYPKNKIKMGIDGCGVVTFAFPLKKMALAFFKLTNPEYLPDKYQKAGKLITESIKKSPEMIAGQKRFNTDLLKVAGDKLTAKSGAEGVFCAGIYDGPGIAIKIADGNKRAVPPVFIEILSRLNYLNEEEIENLKKYQQPVIKNTLRNEVGRIMPAATIKDV